MNHEQDQALVQRGDLAAGQTEEPLVVRKHDRGHGDPVFRHLDGGVPGRWVPNVHEALRELDAVVRPGDAVLVKASLAIGLEAIAEALSGAVAH